MFQVLQIDPDKLHSSILRWTPAQESAPTEKYFPTKRENEIVPLCGKDFPLLHGFFANLNKCNKRVPVRFVRVTIEEVGG